MILTKEQIKMLKADKEGLSKQKRSNMIVTILLTLFWVILLIFGKVSIILFIAVVIGIIRETWIDNKIKDIEFKLAGIKLTKETKKLVVLRLH